MVAEVPVFNSLIDLLIQTANPEQIMNLRASDSEAKRYDELVVKFQAGQISSEERQELAKFETIEHLVRLAKIRAMKITGKQLRVE